MQPCRQGHRRFQPLGLLHRGHGRLCRGRSHRCRLGGRGCSLGGGGNLRLQLGEAQVVVAGGLQHTPLAHLCHRLRSSGYCGLLLLDHSAAALHRRPGRVGLRHGRRQRPIALRQRGLGRLVLLGGDCVAAVQVQLLLALRHGAVLPGGILRRRDGLARGRRSLVGCRQRVGGLLQLGIELLHPVRHLDGGQRVELLLHALGLCGGGTALLHQRLQAGCRSVDGRHGVVDGHHAGPQLCQVLLADLGADVERALQRGGPVRERLGALPCRLADAGVDAKAERVAQQLHPVAGLVVQEVGEAALREHDGLVELGEVQPQQALHLRGQPLGVGGQHVSATLQAGLLGGGVLRVLPPPHHAGRGVGAAVELEVQPHPGLGGELVDDGGDGLLVVAGDGAVEGEGDGVDDAALAGAGGSDECRQLDVGEVHDGGLGVGGEAGHLQAQRPHARTSASSASSSANRSPTRRSSMPSSARYSASSSCGVRP